MTLSAKEIRQLDGPGLARLAWKAGLAPEGTEQDELLLWYADASDQHRWKIWAPDRHVSQAEAVLRQLRARGWGTTNSWRQSESFGQVAAFHPATGQHLCLQYAQADAEALALLRCACLAAASAGR